MNFDRRIEPWEEPPDTIFPIHQIHRGDVKGTVVHYDGEVLRAHGDYSDDMAAALLTARRHAAAEGVNL